MKFFSNKTNIKILAAVTAVAVITGINVATKGGFAFSFIAKAVMGLAIGATAQFALAGAASAALAVLLLYLMEPRTDESSSPSATS